MLNRSKSLAMSTSVLKALPGKLDIKRHSPSILYLGYMVRRKLLSVPNSFNKNLHEKVTVMLTKFPECRNSIKKLSFEPKMIKSDHGCNSLQKDTQRKGKPMFLIGLYDLNFFVAVPPMTICAKIFSNHNNILFLQEDSLKFPCKCLNIGKTGPAHWQSP